MPCVRCFALNTGRSGCGKEHSGNVLGEKGCVRSITRWKRQGLGACAIGWDHCGPLQVRTPLNGCLASAEMLLETSLGAEQRELARTIRVSGSILLSTVSNFLDFFKLEAGKPLDVVRREINVQVRSQCRSTATAQRRQGRSDCLMAWSRHFLAALAIP